MVSLYLAHHGILGQKWGVRRYQNPDGTLTAAGKKRYLDNVHKMHKRDSKNANKSNTTVNTYRQILDIKSMPQTKEIAKDPKIQAAAEKVYKTIRDLDEFDRQIGKDIKNDKTYLIEKKREISDWIIKNNDTSKVEDTVDAFELEFNDRPLEVLIDMEYPMSVDFVEEYLNINEAKYGEKLANLNQAKEEAVYEYGKSVSDYFGGMHVTEFASQWSTNEYSQITSAVYEILSSQYRR